MSLALNHPLTEPKDLEVKTWGGQPPVVYLSTATDVYTIALEDFLTAAWYVLTNANLEPDDLRLVFLDRVRKLRAVRGYPTRIGRRQLRTRRLGLPEEMSTR